MVACVSAAGVASAAAQSTASGASAAAPTSDAPRCAFQRKGHPGYVVWICNESGSGHDGAARILRLRTNAAGVETVIPVWTGPLHDIAKHADAIIVKDEQAHAGCSRYFHLARAGQPETTWNAATEAMRDWIDNAARQQHPQLCYSVDPRAADFVIIWSESAEGLPFAFTEVPRGRSAPQSTGDRSASSPATGDPTPALAGARESEMALAVYPVESGMDGTVVRLGRSLFVADQSATPAASSATAGLAAALRFLAGQVN
jgi:hypothetical protein